MGKATENKNKQTKTQKKNKDSQITLAQTQQQKHMRTANKKQMFKLVWLKGPMARLVWIYLFCLLFPCGFCFGFWARVVWTYLFLMFFAVVAFPMCFVAVLYAPFICGIGWDSPDPWARGEWWATQRQVQRDSQLAAGRCASFRLPGAPPTAYCCHAALRCGAAWRGAPLRCSALRCAALRCAALCFHLVYWLELPWALGLSWVVG